MSELRSAILPVVYFTSNVTVAPMTIACLLGMWFLVTSASFRHIPRFDPLNSTSLMVAASATSHSLFLDDAAVRGASPDDGAANEARIAFVRDEQTGQWGLVRIPY